jgi:DNA polymerase-3 subunit epsilon
MEREICLDTETTGLDPIKGHKIVEIGCVEIINKIKTSNNFHAYVNPQRDMPEGAFKVHGLSAEFLKDKPLFSEVAQDFIDFIGDAKLVIHNAAFDMKFINYELRKCDKEIIERHRVIDSLLMARHKFPGAGNSLDALCKRFKVDSSRRVKHGALLDSELLSEVYVELCGGRQQTMLSATSKDDRIEKSFSTKKEDIGKKYQKREIAINKNDFIDHQKFIKENFKNSSLNKYS